MVACILSVAIFFLPPGKRVQLTAICAQRVLPTLAKLDRGFWNVISIREPERSRAQTDPNAGHSMAFCRWPKMRFPVRECFPQEHRLDLKYYRPVKFHLKVVKMPDIFPNGNIT
jgi:hypothetical protein